VGGPRDLHRLALREEVIGDPALVENLDGASEAFRASHFRRFWLRLAIMRHDSGLAASPPVRDILRVSGAGILLSLLRPLWTDNLLAKRQRLTPIYPLISLLIMVCIFEK
jgi:hypothetical protein